MFHLITPNPIAGECALCGEPVYLAEDRYEFPDGEIVHDDCMIEFVRDHYFQHGSTYVEDLQ